jgi:hypothetical protein
MPVIRTSLGMMELLLCHDNSTNTNFFIAAVKELPNISHVVDVSSIKVSEETSPGNWTEVGNDFQLDMADPSTTSEPRDEYYRCTDASWELDKHYKVEATIQCAYGGEDDNEKTTAAPDPDPYPPT